mmetsp:Transcript_72653/g.235096  ORF Transcript_72653/g.235096 Transcript_72653/m.235096 type:complete len:389 (-) Transcript_72653:383-1549(-)
MLLLALLDLCGRRLRCLPDVVLQRLGGVGCFLHAASLRLIASSPCALAPFFVCDACSQQAQVPHAARGPAGTDREQLRARRLCQGLREVCYLGLAFLAAGFEGRIAGLAGVAQASKERGSGLQQRLAPVLQLLPLRQLHAVCRSLLLFAGDLRLDRLDLARFGARKVVVVRARAGLVLLHVLEVCREGRPHLLQHAPDDVGGTCAGKLLPQLQERRPRAGAVRLQEPPHLLDHAHLLPAAPLQGPKGGVELPDNLKPEHPEMNTMKHEAHAKCLKLIQAAMKDPAKEPQCRKIYETVGVYLGYALAQYSEDYEIDNVLILGRVSSGSGGEVMLEKAKEVLNEEFPELAHIKFHQADEHFKRVGQCIAAAALPPLRGRKSLSRRFTAEQ